MTNRWIHARCTGIDEDTYIKLQKSDDKWYCSNCIALCGLCSGSVLYIIMTEPSNATNAKHGYIHVPHAQQYLMMIIKSYKPPTVHGFALLATQQTYQHHFQAVHLALKLVSHTKYSWKIEYQKMTEAPKTNCSIHVETPTRSRCFQLISMESEGKSLSYKPICQPKILI